MPAVLGGDSSDSDEGDMTPTSPGCEQVTFTSQAPSTSPSTMSIFSVSPRRRAAAKFVHSVPFELTVGVVTLLNLVVVVIETNKRAACYTDGIFDDNCDEDLFLRLINVCCLLVYICEIAARVYVDGKRFLRNWWNVSDVAIVSLSAVAEVFSGVFPSMGFLRMFRALRLLRSLRVAMIQRELYLLVHGFVSTMKALFWAAILMIGLLTMWSILAVEILHPINQEVALHSEEYRECSRCTKSFSSVFEANLTFFNTVVLGDGWADFILPVVDHKTWTLAIFMGVSFSVGLGLVNLILAVIVDRAREAHEEDIDHQNNLKQAKMENVKRSISKLFSTMDVDKSGELSLEELLAGYEESAELRQMLNVLDVEKDDIECVFHIMDSDGSGDVSYNEFIENLYRMKSHNSRTLLVFIKFYVLELRRNVQEELALIKGEILDSLNMHTRMLSEMKPTSLMKTKARQAAVEKKEDNIKEVVSCASVEKIALPHGNNAGSLLRPPPIQQIEGCEQKAYGSEEASPLVSATIEEFALLPHASDAATVSHPHTIQELESCVDQVLSSDDLLRKLATADGVHQELIAAGQPPGEFATEELGERRPALASSGYPVNGTDGQGLQESRTLSSQPQAVQGLSESHRLQQPTSPPPEPDAKMENSESQDKGPSPVSAHSQKPPRSVWAVEDVTLDS